MTQDFPPGYPAWVDRAYFQQLLAKDYAGQQFKIVHLTAEPLSAKGENYASSMFRVKVSIEGGAIGVHLRHFVVKASFAHGDNQMLKDAFNVFPKEIEMYTRVLPALEQLYAAAGETVAFGPKCLTATREPEDLIIMEDLGLAGYRPANRFEGLDMQQAQLALTKLAKLHAASAVWVEKGNTFAKMFDQGIYSDAFKPFMQEMSRRSAEGTRACYAQWPCADLMTKYEPFIEAFMMEGVFELVKRREDRFNVLCHGDMWCNNAMYRYDAETGDAEECMLVDFQMCNYNTPMLDLQYFVYSSLQHELKMTRVDEILFFYHQQLVANLRKLGYAGQLPTLFELQRDYQAVGRYGMMTAFGTLSIAVAPSSEDSDILSFTQDGQANALTRMYLNERYVRMMADLVPMLEKKGMFEEV